MGEKDVTEKILLNYNDVFADIVNNLLFNGEERVHPEDLVDQSPVAAYKADGKIRSIERDVAKRWEKNQLRVACIGFENQTNDNKDEVLLVYAYDGAEYRTQLLKENLKRPRYPVVTLVLYFGYKHRWNAPKTLHEAIDIPDYLKPFVPDIHINLFEIAYLSPEQVQNFKSDFRIVADYFVQKRLNNDYVPPKDELDHIEAVLQLLSVMANDTRFEDAYNDAIAAGKEVHNMCDVLDRVEERGREEGRAEGRAEGENRLGALMQKLLSAGRTDDAMRASTDKEYRQELFKQYGLA